MCTLLMFKFLQILLHIIIFSSLIVAHWWIIARNEMTSHPNGLLQNSFLYHQWGLVNPCASTLVVQQCLYSLHVAEKFSVLLFLSIFPFNAATSFKFGKSLGIKFVVQTTSIHSSFLFTASEIHYASVCVLRIGAGVYCLTTYL